MRFLKRKIHLSHLRYDSLQNQQDKTDIQLIQVQMEMSAIKMEEPTNFESVCYEEIALPTRKPRTKPPCPEGHSKNIVKNYGKALCAFASSKIALPYLQSILSNNKWSSVDIQTFKGFIKAQKDGVNSIESLRKMLVEEFGDCSEVCLYKKIFKQISIIFVKYFAVNWIYGGRLLHKKAHLDFRFKMLRRIKNPEYFTYLRTAAK